MACGSLAGEPRKAVEETDRLMPDTVSGGLRKVHNSPTRILNSSLTSGPGTGLVLAESILGLKLSADITQLAP